MRCDWLVTGAGGQFGSVLVRELSVRGDSALGLISPRGRAPCWGNIVRADITDRDAMADVVRRSGPRFIVHAAAVTRVDEAFADPALARRTNVDATGQAAELADEIGARFVLISTALVFDGTRPPYDERAAPAPLSVYGQTKADAERRTLAFEGTLVVRPPLMYGLPAVSRPTTFMKQLDAIRSGAELRLFEDEFRTPIALSDLARSTIEAARSGETGVLNVGGPQRLSRLEMGRIAARALGRSDRHIIPTRQSEMTFPEPRPRDVSLDSSRFACLMDSPAGQPMAEAMKEIINELDRAGFSAGGR